MSWFLDAVELMLAERRPSGGWGYRPHSAVSVEPTCLASLALLHAATTPKVARQIVSQTGEWLSRLQQPDGAVGVGEMHSVPKWPTAIACLLWAHSPEHQRARDHGLAYLCGLSGATVTKAADSPFAHDPAIPGWPWVDGTLSWIEPTSWAILALQSSHASCPTRVSEGARLILDRAVPDGGWNYGNSEVFGAGLRPVPDVSGLALLALAASRQSETHAITRGLAYLQSALVQLRSPRSLGLALMGWTAWRARPEKAEDWLSAAYRQAVRRAASTVEIAYLVLAANDGFASLLIGRPHGEQPRS